MINTIFIYNGKRIYIQCNLEDKMRNICEKFALKADIKVDSKIYLYNNKPLSIIPELNKTFGQQIDSNDTGDKEIIVLDDPDKEYTVKLHYEGTVKEVKIKQNEKFGSIFEQIGNYFSLKAKSFYTLCNGALVGGEDELDKSISQLSNSMNKETNEINLLIEANESFLSEDNKEIKDDIQDIQNPTKIDEIKAQEIKINERKKVVKFLFKIYVKLLVQYSFIGIFLCLGIYKKINKIFIRNNLSLALTVSFETLFMIYIGILLLKYKKNKCLYCIYFHILIFIPFLTILLFLISSLIGDDPILTFIFLFVLDIISVILFLLIFKRNRGYGILLLALILNAIYICPLYITKHMTTFDHFNRIFSLASVLIFYILLFNNILTKKFDEDEGIAAIYFFNYSFFFVFSVPICICFVSLVIIPLGVALFFLFLVILFYFGGGSIIIFIAIKVIFSLYCKSKKNKINKFLKEFE